MKKRFCLAVSLLFLLFCSLSCEKELFKGEPEEGTEFFVSGYECFVNGEALAHTTCKSYYRIHYKYPYVPSRSFSFSGYIIDNKPHIVTEVNPGELAFYLTLPSGSTRPPLYNGDNYRCPFFFYITGDGKGPFKEGVDYSGPENIVYYFPESSVIVYPRAYQYKEMPDSFNGLEVKLLSSSFRFGYSNRDDICVDEVLDFYFDFEEVITGVPEGYTSTPTVGDTIRVTNGHYAYSLFFDSSSVIHQFIEPK